MCWDTDDDADFYRQRRPRAVKVHRCDECTADIEPGQQYLYVVHKYDGWFSSFKMCARCEAPSTALGAHCRRRERWSTDPPLGGMREAIENEIKWGDFDDDEVTEKWRLRRMAVEFDHRAHAAGLRRLQAARG
jgi:ribosomal protein L24E